MRDSCNVTRIISVLTILAAPIPVLAQSSGSGSSGNGSTGGAASGLTAGTSSAVGSPPAGSAGAGTAAVNGVPSGPANAGGLNNSGNDPSGAGNPQKVPTAPDTNALGTANSSRTPSTTGSAATGPNGRSGSAGRIDGTTTPGPTMPGDAAIREEDAQNSKVDKKIRSICKGC